MIAKIAVLGTFRFPPERIPEVLPHLKVLIETTRKLDGCIAYDVAVDPYDPGLIRMSELWPDRVSLDRHLQAAHLDPWRKASAELGVMDRAFMVYDVTHGKPL